MLRSHVVRRRSPNGPLICVVAAAFLLLLSLSVLHSRLSSSPFRLALGFRSRFPQHPDASFDANPLFDDANNDAFDGGADDRIDELDVLDEEATKKSSSEDILHAVVDDDTDLEDPEEPRNSGSGYFWDHVLAVARRSFGKQEQSPSDPWGDRLLAADDESPEEFRPRDRSKIAFGSDDQPVDEDVRAKLDSIGRIEDALMLKVGSGGNSLLREGWVRWLEGKGDFLRRDRMLRSNLELLNPKNHPLLQDPDIRGVTIYTRGDRMMQKAIWKEMESTPFGGAEVGDVKRVERRRNLHLEEEKELSESEGHSSKTLSKEKQRYADGRRWGYFPGLDPNLSFSEFIDQFLRIGQCSLRVFMVWNSPPWTYGVRHQRGLESLLHHHKNACVVVFSETLELDFFSDFVKDGYKIAVAMPNLDELLKDTPAHVFASVWFEWRKTKHYPVHYSELLRLAALYKYGGIYLDSDVIVLKPLHSLKNSVGVEDQLVGNSIVNGAVMAFDRRSAVMMECLKEFYSTYDDTRLRWNGADLMTRVFDRLYGKGGISSGHLDIKIEPSISFFPVSSMNITRYFVEPPDEIGRSEQEILFTRILNESTAFHFWNGLTSALVPEPNSLVDRLLNHYCLRCLDLL